MAQLASARRSGRRGRRFKSGHPDHSGLYMQDIEIISRQKFWRKNRRQLHMMICYLDRKHLESLGGYKKLSEIPLDNLYSKLLVILWTSLIEVEFNIIICDYNLWHLGLEKFSETNSWFKLIEHYFLNHYNQKKLSEVTLGCTAFHRFKTLSNVITKDLQFFIELRNKFAHGQWAIAFSGSQIKNDKLTASIYTLTRKEIYLLRAIYKNLPSLTRLLAGSRTAFERDFDVYLNRIIRAKNDADLKFKWVLDQQNKKHKSLTRLSHK